MNKVSILFSIFFPLLFISGARKNEKPKHDVLHECLISSEKLLHNAEKFAASKGVDTTKISYEDSIFLKNQSYLK